MIHKYRYGDFIRMGLNYGFDRGFTIILKIPLFPHFRKNYEDPETKNIKSGWHIKVIGWYIRRRNDECYGGRGRRWVIDAPKFWSTPVGKQVITIHRNDREVDSHGLILRWK
jgi:hypothetical protein